MATDHESVPVADGWHLALLVVGAVVLARVVCVAEGAPGSPALRPSVSGALLDGRVGSQRSAGGAGVLNEGGPLAFDDVLLAPRVPDLPHREQHTDPDAAHDHGEHDGEDPAGMPNQQPGLVVGLC